MIEGKEKIVDWYDNLPDSMVWWNIYGRGKVQTGDRVICSSQQEVLSKSQAREELSNALQILSGDYTIVVCEQPGKLSTKGNFREDVRVLYGSNNNQQQQAPVINGIPPGMVPMAEVQKMINDALDKQRLERQLEDLQKQNKELQKELKEGGNDRIGKIVEMFAPQIIGYFTQGAAPAAAVGKIPDEAPSTIINHETNLHTMADETTMTDEQVDAINERLGSVVEAFAAADPNWLETLEKMAAKVKANPGIINTLKAFL